jgi:cell division protein ZapA (FtsZ GTPase activity inhibitor)
MIEEKFLVAAINIKRSYIKLTSNLDFYKKRAEQTLDKLQEAYLKVENLEDEIKVMKKKKDQNLDPNLTSKVLEILNEIEEEGNKIEKFVEPLNKEIEKLAIEEQELYRIIVETHSNLSEEQIVEAVRLRLKKEGLS